MSEFYRKRGRGDPVERAFHQRSRVCRLIGRGLASHPGRLDGRQWREVQTLLQILDPTASWLPLHVADVIEATQRVADEQGGSYDVWNLMEAARFQAWAKELIEILEQYRRNCEALHAG